MLIPLRIKLFSQYKFKKCHQVSICHDKKLLPYFIIHLEQVVTAYNRGQNFRDNELDPNIEPLGLIADEQAGLVAILKTLTDPRVRNEAAPFDHPQINIPNGHPGDEIAINARSPNNQTIASDDFRLIKATGASGRGPRGPLNRFDECIGPDPADGSSNLNNYLCQPNR